ncbi:EF-hand 4 and MCLC and MMR HSR1 domain containing protein [Trichuris trichiura]|uniref:Chloride channel CLIC-like protein 1 n=1 Tax=Trichuris trichiura TaxID=36087 RepID=A0A077ZAQ6_TRITR|nr:EF-hand 4 and MCLC and MMR HSR1 domain containing protein [Trichuris trichiura]
MNDGEFMAPSTILIVGPPSVGKTSLIQYILNCDYPGMKIAPESSADRFTIIMHEKLNIIDTPGIISVEKQKSYRGYDFDSVVTFFADRSDKVIFVFDVYKLDFSEDVRRLINHLQPYEDKIMIVLNKIDSVGWCELDRVQENMMWSLSRTFKRVEVPQVFFGSFWTKPLKRPDMLGIVNRYQDQLLIEIRQLPFTVQVRRLNDVVRRAKLHDWCNVSDEANKCRWRESFYRLKPRHGLLHSSHAKEFMRYAGLSVIILNDIWRLVDSDKDDLINEEEFCLLNWLMMQSKRGKGIPLELPEPLKPPDQHKHPCDEMAITRPEDIPEVIFWPRRRVLFQPLLQDELVEAEDKKHWIDPANMLTFDKEFSAVTNEKNRQESHDLAKKNKDIKELRASLAQCRNDLAERALVQKQKSSKDTKDQGTLCQSEVALFKHLFRKLLSRIPVQKGPTSRELRYIGNLEISHRDVIFLEELLSRKIIESKDLADALFKLANAFTAVDFVPNDELKETSRLPGQAAILASLPYLNLIVLIAVIAYQVNLILRKPFAHIAVWFLLTCFAVSFVWTWYDVYTVKVAESVAKMHKVSVDSCKHPSELSSWSILKSYVGDIFGAVQDDPCFAFHKAMKVDPFWQVKPLQVLAITIAEFFLEPMEVLGEKFNRFYRALFRDLSLRHQLVVFSCFVILFFIILLFVFRYRFRTPVGALDCAPPEQKTELPLQEEANSDSAIQKGEDSKD